MKPFGPLPFLASAVSLVMAAVNLDGSQALLPVPRDGPSPISDPLTYIPDQHDCPLPCSVDLSNVYKWTPFYSLDRLKRCNFPMLLQFSVTLPLDDPNTDVLIRSCLLGTHPAAARDRTVVKAISLDIENPKLSNDVLEPGIDTAPACSVEGKETSQNLTITSGRSHVSDTVKSNVRDLLQGMRGYFEAHDNCDETFIFGFHNNATAGIYVGAALGKKTVTSAIETVLRTEEAVRSENTLAQVCSEATKPETVFGLSIDITHGLADIQKVALGWSKGICAPWTTTTPPTFHPVKVFDIAASPLDNHPNATLNGTQILPRVSGGHSRTVRRAFNHLTGRATCKYIQVQPGDGCASLATKCKITGNDFMKYNTKKDLCSTLKGGDYVCCSAGDPYTPPKPEPPKPGANGICATHVIKEDDTCDKLAKAHGLTVAQIESFNKGKTWGWTECKDMMAKYNMCLSKGDSPLPPPQQGTQCGPLVPGTNYTDRSIPMAELNPCPLKACCSNWGYCGPFPAHCDVHAPAGGGPGTKLPGFQNTCISNCGNDIKKNSGPPFFYSRIGYYESWNMGRKCLWLKAENANKDNAYTHIHWSFLEIDPKTWKPVIKDPYKQWQGFKMLPNVRRIVSFGGWAYSTEPATFNIIRQAIITNRETFATNIAKFLEDEKLDGVDIDWEYPGAPDILVNGAPIGQPGDGVAYLRFLTTLKSKVGVNRSVSIAAPASYWYLKAFPIDRIAAVIDYIVYMTYDLHGQWDYGNVNAFDSCPSGKCIRSHVNLTETRNTLSIITKAGVPNNKIFVGEASYGRSFHMASDGCWGPMCDFTGSRNKSDARPGRCTETGGYISFAEINEILRNGEGRQFHDGGSNSDILLYNGDYISYMTHTTKSTRRSDWEKLNFGGTVDWAVDLQRFGEEDANAPPKLPAPGGEGCILGSSGDISADHLCQFSCNYGFCPEPTCYCKVEGTVPPLPKVINTQEFISWDRLNPDMIRLCKFTCKYGFCPEDSCGQPTIDEWEDGSVDPDPTQVDDGLWNKGRNFQEDMSECMIFQDPTYREATMSACQTTCYHAIQEAKAEGRTTNYGCVAKFPLDKPIPWEPYGGAAGAKLIVPGKCTCDNMLVNWIADTVIEALPIIAQIGCYIVMSTLKTILDVGLQFIPGVGQILDAGMDAVAIAAQLISYTYPEDQDPVGAFEWWLSPCGGSDLVPDEIKQVFDILSTLADGVSSFKRPKNIKPKSGKKGDPANPVDRSKPKQGNGSGPNGTGNSGVKKGKKCQIKEADKTKFVGKALNTLRMRTCTGPPGGTQTTSEDFLVITSLVYGPTATTMARTCKEEWSQACYHYSSVIANNKAWEVLPCIHATTKNNENYRPGVVKFSDSHHKEWRTSDVRDYKSACHIDEYPPRYFLRDTDPEITNAGKPGGQMMRFLPGTDNTKAGNSWSGACFKPHIQDFTGRGKGKVDAFLEKWKKDRVGKPADINADGVSQQHAAVTVSVKPYFKFVEWEHAANPPKDAGLWENPCWPKKLIPNDPGFALWSWDDWYTKNPSHVMAYDYSQPIPAGVGPP